MFTPPVDWIENPPEDIETIVGLLEIYADNVNEKSERGETLRKLLKQAKKHYAKTVDEVRENDPQAFFKPSYEQALLLNCWVWGISFPICFAANRIGKTTAFVLNGILWIYPNNPGYQCFKPYQDLYNRTTYLIQRPAIQNSLLAIKDYLQFHPELMGDPYKQPYDTESGNAEKFATLQKLLPTAYQPCYPLPPIQTGGQIWLGAPDNDFHRHIIMPRWRQYLPKPLLKDSDADRTFIISTRSETNPKTTAHEIICKSYESEDTKWSGDAVHGIILTEGFTKAILDEIKNRVTENAFASWDYTPAEARNQGQKVALAYNVYKKKEELPLSTFSFVKFSARHAPDFIIPASKKADMVRMWENKKEGVARLEGDFFSSSGKVLHSLSPDIHLIKGWNVATLQLEFPNGHFYRGFDPGWDHPSVCVWGYLTTTNIWFIYRVYKRRNATIAERCKDIIELSNNDRQKIQRGNNTYWRETHPYPNSEVFNLSACDYHMFKDDEITGLPYANQYSNEGLILTESTHMRPEERATKTNSLLDPNSHPYLAHPLTHKPPGSKIYFLVDQYGVAEMLDQFDNLFWDRYKAGDLRGEPKDKVPIHGDDELDALSYLVCGPYIWTQYQPKPNIPAYSEDQPHPLNYNRNQNFKHLTHNHGLTPQKVATLQNRPQSSIGHFS